MNFYQLGYAIAAVLSQPPTFSPVEFSSKSRKQCKSGYGCGWTCISTKKKCRVAVTGEAKNFAQYVRQHKGKLTAIQQQKAKAQNIGLQSKATIKRAKTTLTKSTTKPKVITPDKVEDFRPDTSKVPIQKAENAYRHIYSTGAGKFEQEQYSKYLNGIKDEALKGIPFAQKPQLLKELNKVSDEWVANRESVYAAASQSYSSFVAGASGFNRTQAQNRGSGYTKALSDFDAWANKRKQEIFDQTGVTKVKDSRKKLRDLMLEIDTLETVHRAKIASPRPNKQKLRYDQAQAERDSLKHEIKMLVDPDYAAKNLNP